MNKGIKEGHTIYQNTGLQGGGITKPPPPNKTKKANPTNPSNREGDAGTFTKKGAAEDKKKEQKAQHNQPFLERYHNNSEPRVTPPPPPRLHTPTTEIKTDPSTAALDLDTPDPTWTPHTWTPTHHTEAPPEGEDTKNGREGRMCGRLSSFH